MTKDGHPSLQGLDALRARFQEQSRKAQAYYTIMHRVRAAAGSDDAASAWMTEPLSAFDGKTAAQLVADGRADEVLGYIDSLDPGSSG
ncbi:antitoxin Xre/MbcA/ParS toxin-binding domain-containing protein [Noviherbaspirillum sp. UKPF54]|uniref:antitoxin Xre/MbcA/ParS toxin-binding domain-containing protein n=1 Tax=Noviherbaspirillum sp. UKPF54 TaxID=2601898 RepID=UPI001FEF3818|nr:antitoxin Xre/MbcA/ParS toxin-binding domain-containing protein [Noviherbaspirillum sp. UKPF54]